MLIPTLDPKNEFDIEIVGKLIPNPEKFLVPRVNYENWLNIFKALENNWNSSQIYKEYGASTRKLVFTFNKYGWLKKTDKGYYSMNPKGRRAQQIVQNAKNGIISNKDFRSFAEKHLKERDDDAGPRKRHKTIEMEEST